MLVESTGRVVKKTSGHYSVRTESGLTICTVSTRLKRGKKGESDPIAVGDQVGFAAIGPESGLILEIERRRNKLSRRAVGGKSLEQVIVANVDQVLAVFASAQPAPAWGMLDRYLVECEASDLPAVICMTKWDLDSYDLEPELAAYERAGYPVHRTSAISGEGISGLKAALAGKTSVVVGKSGVGKTSLLNALQEGLGAKVSEISNITGKGKHTTTHLEMFDLDCGGSLVDTPGVREFGLTGGTDVAWLFPEFRPYVRDCRFGSRCSHDREPDCAVKEAVEAGDIWLRRYRSYLKLK